jgi:hypothetical protein
MAMELASVDSAAAGLGIVGAVVLPSTNAAEEDMLSRMVPAVVEEEMVGIHPGFGSPKGMKREVSIA